MTAIQELIKEFENIQESNCKTLQERLFFDGVIAIIESKYIEKEKEQIIAAFLEGKFKGGSRFGEESTEYYEKLSLENKV
jgi:adenylosuccinate synthase